MSSVMLANEELCRDRPHPTSLSDWPAARSRKGEVAACFLIAAQLCAGREKGRAVGSPCIGWFRASPGLAWFVF